MLTIEIYDLEFKYGCLKNCYFSTYISITGTILSHSFSIMVDDNFDKYVNILFI